MSLIQKINSRVLSDCINEGAKLALTGTVTNSVTDTVVYPFVDTRSCIVSGFTLSTSASTSIQVSLGFKGSGATTVFFTGFITAGSSITREFALGDWYRGNLGDDLVITTSGTGVTAYSVDARSTSSPSAVSYVSHEASGDHRGQAKFAPESGEARGQH